jgi:hypothetical protein
LLPAEKSEGATSLQTRNRAGKTSLIELGFQMNEDDAFKEKENGFDLKDYCLDVKLTDATENGGLFGMRFD